MDAKWQSIDKAFFFLILPKVSEWSVALSVEKKMEEVRSIAEYIESLKAFQRGGLNGHRQNVRYYYRGESRDYGATSGQAMIGRGHWLEGGNESNLFRECERRLTAEFLPCKSTFEKLVMMQHYGIPTRILDVSLDPLVALFFALYLDPRGKKDDSGDSVVLVYEVPKESIKNYHSDAVSVVSNLAVYSHDNFEMAEIFGKSGKDREAFNKNESVKYLLHEIKAEKPHFWDCINPEDLESVFCVHPLLTNPRIRAQQGAFLLFGMDGNKQKLATLESSRQKEKIGMRKIRIPCQAKEKVREELQLLARTVDVIYPDWDGVSDYFARFYGKSAWEFYK